MCRTTRRHRDKETAPGVRGSKTMGAVAGSLSALAFAALHGVFIVDVWDKAVAMTISGALCGMCLAWSYGNLRHMPSVRSWLAFNSLHVASLLVLGVASLLFFEPAATTAELVVSDNPLGDLVPTALPLMVGATLAGTAVLWAAFSRRLGSLPSVLVAHTLLVVLVGHNLAILGLVELADPVAAFGSFFGATLFLGASFAATFLVLMQGDQMLRPMTE